MKKKDEKIKTFSALEIANFCGVVNQTVVNWIKGGHLKAFITPGGQYRIYSEYLIEFLQRRKMKIPEGLLPFLKGEIKKILIADADKNFLQQLKEKIEQDFPDCVIFTSTSGFDAGVLVATKKPEYIIISENMKDIAIEKLRELPWKDEDDSMFPINYKIIYIKDNKTDNNTEDLYKTADIVLTKPIDFSKVNSLINSSRESAQ
jgi:excisionase family DNA binding protein